MLTMEFVCIMFEQKFRKNKFCIADYYSHSQLLFVIFYKFGQSRPLFSELPIRLADFLQNISLLVELFKAILFSVLIF